MSEKKNASTNWLTLIVSSYIVTLIVTILIIVLATTIFIDTTKCSSVSEALPVLWGIVAVVFLASVTVVRIFAWKVTLSSTGRWAIVAGYGVALLVSFVILAFFLLIIFNC